MLCFVLVLCAIGARGDAAPGTTAPIGTTTTGTETTPVPDLILARVFNSLTGLANNVSSGNIIITGNNVVNIPNFYFDGTVPNTYFLVGEGDEVSESGTVIYTSEDSKSPLSAYHGQNIMITLPDNIKIDDISWIAVWSLDDHKNLGYVYMKEELSPHPQTFSLKDEVTSGPVVLVDKKTLFVLNIHYRGDRSNTRFWVGNGSRPDSSGVAIPDEDGDVGNLHPYNGENIYLNLPDGVSTDNIDYFGVWSIEEERSLGFVPIVKAPESAPGERKAAARPAIGAFTVRVPKCCKEGELFTPNSCKEKSPVSFEPDFNVYEHNETHFRNESLDLATIRFEAFHSEVTCSRFALNQKYEEFALLLNGSLLVRSADIQGIFSSADFCMDNFEYNNTHEMTIFVCFPQNKYQTTFAWIYLICVISSIGCFGITVFFHLRRKTGRNFNQDFFIAYVVSMTVTFVCIAVVQFFDIYSDGCKVLGFLIQPFTIASFILLAVLCVDLLRQIDSNPSCRRITGGEMTRRRKLCYWGLSIVVPLVSLVVSLILNLTPAVPFSFVMPRYRNSYCFFKAGTLRSVLLFYFPVALAIVASLASLVMAKCGKDRRASTRGDRKKKFIWTKYLIVIVISSLGFGNNLVRTYFAEDGILIAVDIIQAIQGVIVFFLFVVKTKIRTQIKRSIKKARHKKKLPEEGTMLREFGV